MLKEDSNLVRYILFLYTAKLSTNLSAHRISASIRAIISFNASLAMEVSALSTKVCVRLPILNVRVHSPNIKNIATNLVRKRDIAIKLEYSEGGEQQLEIKANIYKEL